jgi:predicted adenylyl cyclase CyaB
MSEVSQPPPRLNLERKARCRDLDAARSALEALPARREGEQQQTDTYFLARHGRLKLREIEGREAVLISYERPDGQSARLSRYYLVPVTEPLLMKTALTAALGLRGAVHKCREVYHWHNVRIHLDEVAGLGAFVEFEAVLGPGDDEATAHERLTHLGRLLGLLAEDEQGVSYADLLGL